MLTTWQFLLVPRLQVLWLEGFFHGLLSEAYEVLLRNSLAPVSCF